jgi:hypothetical protein
MLVFIDESGDSGRKFNAGSSIYFTCVAAIFSDNFNADACDRSIDELRRGLKLANNYEFHFTNCHDRIRREFLKKVAIEQFRYYGFVLNKAKLFGNQFQDKDGFYDFTVGLICENARNLLRDAKVVIDKCGDREFKRRLEKSLKQRMIQPDGTCCIKKVGMESSHTNNLVQLADMLCGAVTRSYTSNSQRGRSYRALVGRREDRVQFWPK